MLAARRLTEFGDRTRPMPIGGRLDWAVQRIADETQAVRLTARLGATGSGATRGAVMRCRCASGRCARGAYIRGGQRRSGRPMARLGGHGARPLGSLSGQRASCSLLKLEGAGSAWVVSGEVKLALSRRACGNGY